MDNVNKYRWTPSGGMPIDDFLKKYKPSLLDKTDAPWIWVSTGGARDDPEAENNALVKAVGKGQVVLDEVTKRVAAIEKDDKIPVRGKKGVLSKKQARDEAQKKAADALREISLEMSFPRTESVDAVWAKIARSVAYGPLRDAGVMTAKVATLDPMAGDMGTHVVIIYVDNIYDKDMVTKVLVSLLEDHGIDPSASKSDLYTLLGIDSKHASGMRSSIWRSSELVKDVKALKAKYKPGSEKKWVRKDEPEAKPASKSPRKSGSKEPSPGLEKGVSFSDKVDVKAEPQRSPVKQNGRPTKRLKSAAAIFKENDIFASDSEEE
ncbi:uncharacterized protein CcaverHIS019_0602810 [Cutaneotrichosporon cavernicola]|uniref:DUF1917-domain-containing protein n=1 Tax=Cutaneotrichosporon cavernicola TaxID=279322 RepID=A0AA48L8B5_9TREE|nr:uncharacterized protein CcaverHIS019_0602810 [Cutaneotrichosporon cavernicola]BEI93822.1 hypothetical protein CcaverHIS019_0602810 [Cutaneotrichosporon cavernicola]BEJ01598.1 hypothetical protein CcaverHIS631_0602800 [Cutaneotrichosporon cavernicola]